MADIGTLNPEQMLQQQQILRQQKMAEMLMQQGMQQPQGQMVSGRYVAPSIFQNLAGLANQYVGQRGIEKAEQAQVDLAKRLRADETSAMADFMQRKEAGNVDYANLYADPRASAAQRQFAFTKMNEGPIKVGVEDTLIDPRTMKPVFTGAGKPRAPLQIDTGTAIELRDPNNPTIVLQRIPKSISPADAARMQFEGITGGTGGGMPMGNVPAAGGMPMGNAPVVPMGNAPAQQMNNVIAPSAQPQYQYNSALSPKENQARAAKFIADADKNLKNAQESFNVIKDAADLFNTGQPTSGGLKNIRTGVAEFFDIPTQAADADARLEILGQKLVQQVPRFEGPQSDKDVASYKAAAGDLGNASKTITSRMSALNTLIDLNKKYYPQGNWDSIDLAGPVTTRQTFLKGQQKIDPATFSQGLNAQDKEAFNWARKNPTDPRAAQINQRLGIR
jgi:hypothetical protein